uniref:Sas10 domain-containing protein n=1 Tax=Rodentolepis nana TaxID=102285 RepID=A0A0R3TP26_RODNA
LRLRNNHPRCTTLLFLRRTNCKNSLYHQETVHNTPSTTSKSLAREARSQKSAIYRNRSKTKKRGKIPKQRSVLHNGQPTKGIRYKTIQSNERQLSSITGDYKPE